MRVADQHADRLAHRLDGMPPRRMLERQRLQIARREHRLALLKMPHRPPCDLQRRRNRRQYRPAPRAPRARNLRERARAVGPDLPQHAVQRLRLGLARRQRRNLRLRLPALPALLVDKGQDRLSPGRERIPQLLVVARDLEALQPPRHRRRDRIAPFDQAARQLVAVEGPDQPRVPAQQRRFDALPTALTVTGHVGHHRMRVQLRVEVPARHMPEQRRRKPVPLHARAPAGLRVPAPRLQHRLLDPVQRRPHRLVMAAQHRPVAARMLGRRQQRRQRHGFRGREGDVETRTVLVLPVPLAPEADAGAGHITLEEPLERARRDFPARLQPNRSRSLSMPGARLPVLLRLRPRRLPVAAGRHVIPALLVEIRRRRGRRRQTADTRHHEKAS